MKKGIWKIVLLFVVFAVLIVVTYNIPTGEVGSIRFTGKSSQLKCYAFLTLIFVIGITAIITYHATRSRYSGLNARFEHFKDRTIFKVLDAELNRRNNTLSVHLCTVNLERTLSNENAVTGSCFRRFNINRGETDPSLIKKLEELADKGHRDRRPQILIQLLARHKLDKDGLRTGDWEMGLAEVFLELKREEIRRTFVAKAV